MMMMLTADDDDEEGGGDVDKDEFDDYVMIMISATYGA